MARAMEVLRVPISPMCDLPQETRVCRPGKFFLHKRRQVHVRKVPTASMQCVWPDREAEHVKVQCLEYAGMGVRALQEESSQHEVPAAAMQ